VVVTKLAESPLAVPPAVLTLDADNIRILHAAALCRDDG
jgi:hypothetical protein